MSPAVFIDANVPSYVMHQFATLFAKTSSRRQPPPPAEGADLTTPLP